MATDVERKAREWAHHHSSHLVLCWGLVPPIDDRHSLHCNLMTSGYITGHAAALEGSEKEHQLLVDIAVSRTLPSSAQAWIWISEVKRRAKELMGLKGGGA